VTLPPGPSVFAPFGCGSVGEPQHRRMLVGVLTLKDEYRLVSHPGVGDHGLRLVAGIEK